MEFAPFGTIGGWLSIVVGLIYLGILIYFISLAGRFVSAVERIADRMRGPAVAGGWRRYL